MTLCRRMKPPRAVSISRLPEHILVEIFNKMSNKELVRMRRTCKSMNSVAKKNEKQLASRPALGSSIAISYCGYRKQLSFRDSNYYSFENEEDFVKSVAGISFFRISVDICSYYRDAFVEVLKLFKRIRPICHKFKMPECPLDLIVPITDCLIFQIDFNTSNLRDYINGYRTLKGALNVLSTLRKARNCSKFKIWVPEYTELTEGVYDKVKDFLRFSFNTNASGFEELLWDLHNLKERVTMKSMSITFQKHYSEFDPRKLPPFFKIQKPVGSKEDVVPAAVYLMMLKSQCVFIFERISYKRQEIHITEKTAEDMEEQIMSIYRYPEYAAFMDDDRRQRHIILTRNVRAIVKSLLEE